MKRFLLNRICACGTLARMARDEEIQRDRDQIEVQTKAQVDRMLSWLRETIRMHGHTQHDVQAKLGWGGSYISQILTKQKTLRFDQLFKILTVVDADPGEFFAELFGGAPRPTEPQVAIVSVRDPLVRNRVDELVECLVGKGILTAKEALQLPDTEAGA